MKYWFLSFLLASMSTFSHSEDNINPFTSDGCSAFPDGTFEEKKLWLSCCTDHDLAYWAGGTYEERSKADSDLRQCVLNTGKPLISSLMLAGVRVGGTPYLPTKFRWGYGWPYLRGYKPISANEQIKVEVQLKTINK